MTGILPIRLQTPINQSISLKTCHLKYHILVPSEGGHVS